MLSLLRVQLRRPLLAVCCRLYQHYAGCVRCRPKRTESNSLPAPRLILNQRQRAMPALVAGVAVVNHQQEKINSPADPPRARWRWTTKAISALRKLLTAWLTVCRGCFLMEPSIHAAFKALFNSTYPTKNSSSEIPGSSNNRSSPSETAVFLCLDV